MLATHHKAAGARPSASKFFAPTNKRPVPRILAAKAASKALTGPCIVDLYAQDQVKLPTTARHDPGISIADYMAHAVDNFSNMELPMGGKLVRADDKHLELTVPRIQLFDVWLQPRAMSAVSIEEGRIVITSSEGNCILEGSHHVKQFKLNERFNLDVRIVFSWEDPGAGFTASSSSISSGEEEEPRIKVDGNIRVQVDIPAPFSFMPKPIIEATGNTALAASLTLIMRSFGAVMVEDYARWATDSALRRQRSLAAAAKAESA